MSRVFITLSNMFSAIAPPPNAVFYCRSGAGIGYFYRSHEIIESHAGCVEGSKARQPRLRETKDSDRFQDYSSRLATAALGCCSGKHLFLQQFLFA